MVLLIVAGATLGVTYFTSYKDQPVLKHCLWLAFVFQISMLHDAFYARSIIMAGLGLIGINAHYKIPLNGERALMGLASIIGWVLVYRFFPKYGSAYFFLLYSLLVVDDVHRLVYNAEKSKDLEYDPINESIHIYLDATNFFFRVCFNFHNIEVYETKKEKL